MKRKPIRINWDDLEEAFDNPNPELTYYLDLVNGHVVLEGEGEEGSDDGDEDYAAVEISAAAALRSDATRVSIEPLTPETKIEWLERFVEEAEDLDAGFVEQVRQALDSEDPTPQVIGALRDNPESKDRWYRYRSDRLHERIDAWIRDHGVEVTDPSPWA